MPRLSDALRFDEELVPVPAAGHGSAPPVEQVASEIVQVELNRLSSGHTARLRNHGPRTYRHPDGSLQPHAPPRDPLTVANRRRWGELSKHCRQLPGVDQALERTGMSARYGIGVSHQEHAAAMAAIGLEPEHSARAVWYGFDEATQDPLADIVHPLTAPAWREVTRYVLVHAQDVHGAGVLQRSAWSRLWQEVSGAGEPGEL